MCLPCSLQIDTEVTAHAAMAPRAPRPSAQLFLSLLAALRSVEGVPALAAVRVVDTCAGRVYSWRFGSTHSSACTAHVLQLPALQLLDDEELPSKGPTTVHACLEVLLAQASHSSAVAPPAPGIAREMSVGSVPPQLPSRLRAHTALPCHHAAALALPADAVLRLPPDGRQQ